MEFATSQGREGLLDSALQDKLFPATTLPSLLCSLASGERTSRQATTQSHTKIRQPESPQQGRYYWLDFGTPDTELVSDGAG